MGYVELTKILLQHGASVNAKDHNEFTPFISACYNGHVECAFCFIDHLTDQCGKVNVDQHDKVSIYREIDNCVNAMITIKHLI